MWFQQSIVWETKVKLHKIPSTLKIKNKKQKEKKRASNTIPESFKKVYDRESNEIQQKIHIPAFRCYYYFSSNLVNHKLLACYAQNIRVPSSNRNSAICMRSQHTTHKIHPHTHASLELKV